MGFSVLMWFYKIPFTLTRAGYFSMRFCTVVSNSNGTEVPFKRSILPELVSKFGNERMLQKVFKKRPELNQSDLTLWKCFVDSMHYVGFKFEDCLKIISSNPFALSLTEENVIEVMKTWELCTSMNLDKLKILIINQPDFLHLEPREIHKRIRFLKVFATSQEWLLTLLLLCPNVMFENWSEVEKKINFLNYEMVVYRPEVLQCKALSKSLEFIKMRFLITERCGCYIRPHKVDYKQTKAEILKLNNPKLKEIIDWGDVLFAKKVAKITLEEYQVFSEMFDLENNQSSDSSDSSDSDEESG